MHIYNLRYNVITHIYTIYWKLSCFNLTELYFVQNKLLDLENINMHANQFFDYVQLHNCNDCIITIERFRA